MIACGGRGVCWVDFPWNTFEDAEYCKYSPYFVLWVYTKWLQIKIQNKIKLVSILACAIPGNSQRGYRYKVR